MKSLLAPPRLRMAPVILVCLLIGACCSIPSPADQENTFPVLIGRTTGDGYEYEVWLREDGTRYLKHENKTMDIE